jgi:hypothetical protein
MIATSDVPQMEFVRSFKTAPTRENSKIFFGC